MFFSDETESEKLHLTVFFAGHNLEECLTFFRLLAGDLFDKGQFPDGNVEDGVSQFGKELPLHGFAHLVSELFAVCRKMLLGKVLFHVVAESPAKSLAVIFADAVHQFLPDFPRFGGFGFGVLCSNLFLLHIITDARLSL